MKVYVCGIYFIEFHVAHFIKKSCQLFYWIGLIENEIKFLLAFFYTLNKHIFSVPLKMLRLDIFDSPFFDKIFNRLLSKNYFLGSQSLILDFSFLLLLQNHLLQVFLRCLLSLCLNLAVLLVHVIIIHVSLAFSL
jgi:hypothetical protein